MLTSDYLSKLFNECIWSVMHEEKLLLIATSNNWLMYISVDLTYPPLVTTISHWVVTLFPWIHLKIKIEREI